MSSKDVNLNTQIESLRQAINELEGRNSIREMCSNSLAIGAGVIPFIMLLFLYFLKPKKLMSEDDQEKFDKKKMFFATLFLSVICWIVLYVWAYYKGKRNMLV
jgi:hypothetical protein